ncbi:hypothetical protein Q4574_16405 [Aliiglaciecola sp. 3_MG-2023]|uniref:hypothetical protein n=1 Tax=Aliiglaciecola sp. 3_MG-2023 TaxID=3062644 RepID=UPI0026E3EA35|nr:hypothetical protein [Aliiglaciecola sp. 3_MG-2023]MDO6694881.1 hypothetical protein [Aliiglaciecola sp. 3_MG-2023]
MKLNECKALQYCFSAILIVFGLFTNAALAQEKAVDHVLYQTDKLKIMPDDNGSLQSWCTLQRKHEFPKYVRLRAEHKLSPAERATLFTPNYETFVEQKLIPVIENICGQVTGFQTNYDIRLEMMNWSPKFGYQNWDFFIFRYRDGQVTRYEYKPYSQAKASMPAEAILALTPQPQLDRVNRLLGNIGPFNLYPHHDPFCYSGFAHIDAVFNTSVKNRDEWVTANYEGKDKIGFEGFVAKEILPLVRKSCKRASAIQVHFYKEGSLAAWERMTFHLAPRAGMSLKAHHMSQKAKEYATLRINERVFGTCTSSPYCSMLGGVYLDAIYRNDTAVLKRIDQQLEEEYARSAGTPALKQFTSYLLQAGIPGANKTDFRLRLPVFLAGKYIYNYSLWATTPTKLTGDRTAACFRKGTKLYDTRVTTEVLDYEDLYGNYAGSVGGIQLGTKYRVNPEFHALCDKICGAAIGEIADFMDSYFGLEKTGLILAGLETAIRELDCQSDMVKKFEKHLIMLADKAYR